MRFCRKHAKDVALPSACLLADRLAPHIVGRKRQRLVKAITTHLLVTLKAYAEFHPAGRLVPRPSRN